MNAATDVGSESPAKTSSHVETISPEVSRELAADIHDRLIGNVQVGLGSDDLPDRDLGNGMSDNENLAKPNFRMDELISLEDVDDDDDVDDNGSFIIHHQGEDGGRGRVPGTGNRKGGDDAFEGNIIESCLWHIRSLRWLPHYYLYMENFLSSWGDRMWGFAVFFALSKSFDQTMLPSALFALICTFAVYCVSNALLCHAYLALYITMGSNVLFGSYFGTKIDQLPRLKLLAIATIIQNAAVVVAFIFLAVIVIQFSGDQYPMDNVEFIIMLAALIFFGSVAQIASMVCSIAISKDWTIVVSQSRRFYSTPSLSHMNGMNRRISLVCKIAAPLFFGLVVIATSIKVALVLVALWNAISCVIEVGMQLRLYHHFTELATPKLPISSVSSSKSFWSSLRPDNLQLYLKQSVTLPSLAYVSLYMTALSPGALLISYMLYKKTSTIEVSLFQAVSSLIGIVSTFITPTLFSYFGLNRSGLFSIWYDKSQYLPSQSWTQWGMFAPVLFMLFFFPSSNIWWVLVPIALSRAPLWAFDLAETQQLQEFVAENDRGKIAGVEFSLTSVASMMVYIIGIILGDPGLFKWLGLASTLALSFGAILYSWWYYAYSSTHVSLYDHTNDLAGREIPSVDFGDELISFSSLSSDDDGLGFSDSD